MFSGIALKKLLQEKDSYQTVLDIGSGGGKHAEHFRAIGKDVTCVDIGKSVPYSESNDYTIVKGNYLEIDFKEKYDLIWASHVLEHQLNVSLFLNKIREDLKEGGILCITVPPLKHQIVGGHLSLWNAGLLIYNLVLARFDCKDIRVKKYGYNISIILKKVTIKNFPDLSYDRTDIPTLKPWLPDYFHHGFDGDILEENW